MAGGSLKLMMCPNLLADAQMLQKWVEVDSSEAKVGKKEQWSCSRPPLQFSPPEHDAHITAYPPYPQPGS